jgi:DNA ligase-1
MKSLPSKFKPMLACEAPEFDKLNFPMLAQPKLDGIRCIVVDGIAYSRKLKPIPNKYVQEMVSGWPNPPRGFYDGELMMANAQGFVDHAVNFSDVSSAVMSDIHENESLIRFSSFYKGDIDIAKSLYISYSGGVIVSNEEELNDVVADFEKSKYEGTMLWNINQEYKFGRSTKKDQYLLKVKKFFDDEAVVVGYIQKYKNNNPKEKDALGNSKRASKQEFMEPIDEIGSIIVEWSGTKFKIGSGFTQEQRQILWRDRDSIIGKLAKFKYQELASKGKPRFPVFLGFRDKRDL